MPLPDWDEPRPLEGCRELEEDVDAEDEGEPEEVVVDVALVDAVVDDRLDDAEVPGMVAALTTAKTPTPANAPIAAPAVSRLRRRIASSRARILAWVRFRFSITMRKLESSRWTKPGERLGSY